MAIKIASDIHGKFDELVRQLTPEDTLILCGDYIQFIDYDTLDGVLAELLPKEHISHVLGLIEQKKLEEAKIAVGEIFMTRPKMRQSIGKLIRRDYDKLFSLLPCKTYLIYGNTDNPDLIREHENEKCKMMEAGTVQINGLKFGFVSGMPPTAFTFGLPGEITEAEFARRLHELGPVDVLITHTPPAITDLTYDVVSKRDEEGSVSLLEYIERFQPKWNFFGHVHQPRVDRLRHMETELINVSFHVMKGGVFSWPPDEE